MSLTGDRTSEASNEDQSWTTSLFGGDPLIRLFVAKNLSFNQSDSILASTVSRRTRLGGGGLPLHTRHFPSVLFLRICKISARLRRKMRLT